MLVTCARSNMLSYVLEVGLVVIYYLQLTVVIGGSEPI